MDEKLFFNFLIAQKLILKSIDLVKKHIFLE